MMRKSQLTLTLLAAAATMAVAVSACSGGGGDDDDDNTPLPNDFDFCIANWDTVTDPGPPLFFDRFVVIADTPLWTTGTLNFGNGAADPIPAILWRIENGVGYTNLAVATNGSASVTAPSNSIGEPVDVDIATAPTAWFVDDVAVGSSAQSFTGGNGSLTGAFFSEFEECFEEAEGDCPQGTGTITAAVNGSALSFGADAAFVYCNDSTAFQGMSREQLMRLLSKVPFGGGQ